MSWSWGTPKDARLSDPEWHELKTHFHRIERLITMATQAEVDAITAEVQGLDAPLSAIQSAITDLEAQVAAGQPVDLTSLKAAADSAVAQVATLTSTIPAPAPAPAPAPSPTTSSSTASA